MRSNGRTGGLAKAGEDVDDARWEASFLGELGGIEGTEGSLFGGFQDNCIAACDSWANLPCPHEQWEVPWNDLAADTDLVEKSAVLFLIKSDRQAHRFLLNIVESVGVRIHDLALNLVRPATIISQAAGAHANIDLGHTERLAIVQRLNGRELIKISLEEICKLDEIFSALLRGDFSPSALEGLAGGRNGNVDIFLAGFVDGCDGFFG